MVSASIIADSKNEHGQRLTTFVLTFPRIVLAEFNTHRMLSRNSASSRAIPFKKMLKMVQENPFIPIKWMKEHTGMQGTEYFTDDEVEDLNLRYAWVEAGIQAAKQAEWLSNRGLTKQICNRLLEPFMWHTVIVTGSEWSNFFALRAHPAAEIHIQDLAHKMLEEYNKSTPKQLYAGDWHVPFNDNFDKKRLDDIYVDYCRNNPTEKVIYNDFINQLVIKIATARCARVSYLNFDGSDDYEKDIELHDKLVQMGHFSPLEHCARAMSKDEYGEHISGRVVQDGDIDYGEGQINTSCVIDDSQLGWCGNFRGFLQYRKMIQGENKSDNRINKK